MAYPNPYKRSGNPYYRFDYYIDGKRKTKSTHETTIRAAKDRIKEFNDKINSGLNTTFGNYCQPFYVWDKCPHIRRLLSENKSIGEEHAENQRRLLEKYVFSHKISKIPLNELKRGDIIDFRSRIRQKYTDVIANKSTGVIKSILNEAFFRGDIARDIASKIGNIKIVTKKKGIFTLDELVLFFINDELWDDDRKKLAFLIASDTGMRRGEVLALQLQDLYFTTENIYIQRAWKYSKKKKGYILGLPKWNRKRKTGMTVRLSEALQEYIKDKNINKPERLIISWDNGERISFGSWQRWFDSLLKKCEINKKSRNLTPHCFRDSFITHMREAGADESILQETVAHKDMKTMDGYTHYQDEALTRPAKMFDKLLSKLSEEKD